MTPEIGTKVYCIYNGIVLDETVAFLGEESFITDSFFDECKYRDSLEWRYDDFNKTWFTDFHKARRKAVAE